MSRLTTVYELWKDDGGHYEFSRDPDGFICIEEFNGNNKQINSIAFDEEDADNFIQAIKTLQAT